MSTMFITRHAKRRYMERIAPGADEREAFVVLRDAVGRARRTGRTYQGQAVWVVDDPAMRLVSKHDSRHGMILVTVLGPELEHAVVEEESVEHVLELPRVRLPAALAVAPRPTGAASAAEWDARQAAVEADVAADLDQEERAEVMALGCGAGDFDCVATKKLQHRRVVRASGGLTRRGWKVYECVVKATRGAA